MDDQIFYKHRRNFLISCLFLIFYKYAEAEITSISSFQVLLKFGNPDAIIHIAWMVWSYYFIRYIQSYYDYGKDKYQKQYNTIARKVFINYIVKTIKEDYTTYGYSRNYSYFANKLKKENFEKREFISELELHLLLGRSTIRREKVSASSFNKSLTFNLYKVCSGKNGCYLPHLRINLSPHKRTIKQYLISSFYVIEKSIKTIFSGLKYFFINFKSILNDKMVWTIIGVNENNEQRAEKELMHEWSLGFFGGFFLKIKIWFGIICKSSAFLQYKFPFLISLPTVIYYLNDYLKLFFQKFNPFS